MTYLVLTDDTQKIIHRSTVRSALNEDELNLRLNPLGGELKDEPVEVVKLPPTRHPETNQSQPKPSQFKPFGLGTC